MMKSWCVSVVPHISVVALLAVTGCSPDNQPAAVAQEADVPALSSVDLYAGSPYLRELRNALVYGEIWERPQLAKRDRSMITIAVLQALAREELAIHIPRGLDNGLTPQEISEIILHVTFYAGWPTGVQASLTAAEVFEERGLSLSFRGLRTGPRSQRRVHSAMPMRRYHVSGSCEIVSSTPTSGSGRFFPSGTGASSQSL